MGSPDTSGLPEGKGRMMRKILVLITVAIMILTCPWLVSTARAGIGAQPAFQEFEGQPGEVIEGVYSVYNTGDKPLAVEVYFKDHFKMDENKDIFAKDWLSCEEMKFTLKAEEKKDIKFRARVPQEAFAEIMGMIYFCAASSTGSTIKMSYGVPVYIRIKDTAVTKAQLDSFKIEKVVETPKEIPHFYRARLLLENKGNVHLRPKIKVRLLQDGEFVKTILFPFGKPVFPGNSHNYQTSWNVGEFEISPGIYKAESEVAFNGSILKKQDTLIVEKGGKIYTK